MQHRSDAWIDIRPQAVGFSVRTAPRSRSACSAVCIVSCGLHSCGGKGILPTHMRALAGLHNREFRGAGTKRLAATWGHKRWLHKLTFGREAHLTSLHFIWSLLVPSSPRSDYDFLQVSSYWAPSVQDAGQAVSRPGHTHTHTVTASSSVPSRPSRRGRPLHATRATTSCIMPSPCFK